MHALEDNKGWPLLHCQISPPFKVWSDLLNGNLASPQLYFETEESLVTKVVIIFGVLEQLGFTRQRVEEAVRSSRTLELEDVIEWVST